MLECTYIKEIKRGGNATSLSNFCYPLHCLLCRERRNAGFVNILYVAFAASHLLCTCGFNSCLIM